MAATAPKMSASGDEPRTDAAPVFCGAPVESVPVASVPVPVGRRVMVALLDGVALRDGRLLMVPLVEAVEVMSVVEPVLVSVVDSDALVLEDDSVELELAVLEAEDEEADEVAELPVTTKGPM